MSRLQELRESLKSSKWPESRFLMKNIPGHFSARRRNAAKIAPRRFSRERTNCCKNCSKELCKQDSKLLPEYPKTIFQLEGELLPKLRKDALQARSRYAARMLLNAFLARPRIAAKKPPGKSRDQMLKNHEILTSEYLSHNFKLLETDCKTPWPDFEISFGVVTTSKKIDLSHMGLSERTPWSR